MSFFHFDPVTLAVVLIGLIGGYFSMRNSSQWHTEWIKKHEKDCNEYKNRANDIFTELKVANAQLAQMAETSTRRLDRVEERLDAK